MIQGVRDGFEGMGYLFELQLFIAALAFVFPIVTVSLKIRSANRGQVLRGGYVWVSVCAYLVSVLSGWWFVPLAFTDNVLQITIFDCLGTVSALVSLGFALRSRGSGHWPATAGAIYATLFWLPFFYGRVLLHL